MSKEVESRARTQCAVDAEAAGIPRREIPAKVERLWPVAAREMMGVLDPQTLPEPADLAQREAEYRQLKR